MTITPAQRRGRFRPLTDQEAAALGVAYLAGESIPQIVERFGLRCEASALHYVKKCAVRQWQAQRRCALARRGELAQADEKAGKEATSALQSRRECA